jgi:protein gp37
MKTLFNAIGWCHFTVNFWWGCAKVSPACAHCYAEFLSKIWSKGRATWGPNGARWIRTEAALSELRGYARLAKKTGQRFRIFINSMSDTFEDRRDLDAPRAALFAAALEPEIAEWLDLLLLTKRPEHVMNLVGTAMINLDASIPTYTVEDEIKIRAYLNGKLSDEELKPLTKKYRRSDASLALGSWLERKPPANIWIGTTVENQEMADLRVPQLLAIPATVRFLSIEPQLGPIDLSPWLPDQDADRDTTAYYHYLRPTDGLHWVINGFESGPDARPGHPDWARSLRDQCFDADMPFYFKQWGEWVPFIPIRSAEYPKKAPVEHVMLNGTKYTPENFSSSLQSMIRVGKKAAGRQLDGIEHNEFPTMEGRAV